MVNKFPKYIRDMICPLINSTMKKKKLIKNYFLSLRLNTELFAVPVSQVLEVLEKQEITNVPHLPSYIKGMMNFRGEILPVIEAREKFNMPLRPEEDKYVIIVLELEVDGSPMMIGLMVDQVKDVLSFEPTDIKTVPEVGSNYNTDFLEGMIKLEDHFIMVLRMDRVFSQEEISILTESQATV